ncbi:MAG: amino acid racemase [Gammaproteobacteria bacterium]|nr:amino acid racemase [Gammaproteobacteria bacterium]
MQLKTAGILGGMGPGATIDFMSKVLRQTPAHSDQDHIRLLVDHNPQVPNRHAAINGKGEDSGPHLARMAVGLEQAGADFLAMTCNTAHAFQQDIQNAVAVPFVSIVDEVVGALERRFPDKIQVGLMAAEGCLQAELYQPVLVAAGFQPVTWNARQLKEFMTLVYRIKLGDTGAEVRQKTAALADLLVQGGAEVLVAACTEIPLVFGSQGSTVPLLDSTDVLVASIIDYSLGHKMLPGLTDQN